jgi:putative ubiquitin-RnfH superfamily antitoxin RatB of RatAB toxin-antitoxin module
MISVTVALALPDRQEVVALCLEEGSTVADALERSGLARRFPEVDLAAAPVGVWSRRCERSALLRDGDRVEVYRPLLADPKEMRRRRARLKPSP